MKQHGRPEVIRLFAAVHNHFPTERHLQNLDTYKQTPAAALAERRSLLTA